MEAYLAKHSLLIISNAKREKNLLAVSIINHQHATLFACLAYITVSRQQQRLPINY
jgi:hypothetical protein